MTRPSSKVRQVDEGGVQIGDSHEDVGFDDGETLEITAQHCTAGHRHLPRAQPCPAGAQLGRAQGADPRRFAHLSAIDRTTRAPFLVTCHSGITLAAVHSRLLPLWLEGRADAPDLEAFSETRFAVSSAA